MEEVKVSREAKVLVGILIVVVGGMIALFALSGAGTQSASTGATADASKLMNASSHKEGNGSVTLVEFGDYQCPACGAAYPIIKQLQSEYPGKLTLVFRNFPLPMHPNAPAAANAAEAAALQGKFWEMHDKLYETQNDWAEDTGTKAAETFAGYAQELGLNLDTYQQDVAGAAVQKAIEADKADGAALGINGTPTIYVNGHQATDYGHDTIKSLIDDQLKQK